MTTLKEALKKLQAKIDNAIESSFKVEATFYLGIMLILVALAPTVESKTVVVLSTLITWLFIQSGLRHFRKIRWAGF